jgi:hypothetical protein
MKKFIFFLCLFTPLALMHGSVQSDDCILAQTTSSPPHFYVKLQPMTFSKEQCKQTARKAMKKLGFIDLVSGKHGVWGVKEGYKAQIKCSQAEQAIVFVVVGENAQTVINFNDQLQRNFGRGFRITRDL